LSPDRHALACCSDLSAPDGDALNRVTRLAGWSCLRRAITLQIASTMTAPTIDAMKPVLSLGPYHPTS
jgi:hypothetical protein